MKGWIDMMFNIDEKDILEIRELIEDYENKKLVSEIIDKAWDATDYDDIEKFTKIEKLSDEAYKVEWNTRDKLIKKASGKNKMFAGKLVGGVAQLKKNKHFGQYVDEKYIKNSVTGFDAYYWYTKWTNDPTDCNPDFSNGYAYDSDGNLAISNPINKNVVSPIQTTQNGSLVELADGRRVFVEGKVVQSGDYVNVNGVKYRVK